MARTLLQRMLTHDMWGVFVDDVPFDPAMPTYGSSAKPVVTPSSSVFWADPFFVDDSTLLVEQLDYSVGYGRIFQVPIDQPEAASPVLDDGVHSSFPFVIDVDGDTLVIPERSANNRMEVYRWEAGRLALAHVALEGSRVIDPVIWYDEGLALYFLFFLDGSRDHFSTLCLWMSDRIDGAWEEHPASPIAHTAAGARPAGAMQTDGGTLYRLGQDCVDSYGAAVISFLVEEIDADHYVERRVGRTESAVAGFEHGFHTISRSPSGSRFVIDARRYQSTWTSPKVVKARAGIVNRRLRRLAGRTRAESN